MFLGILPLPSRITSVSPVLPLPRITSSIKRDKTTARSPARLGRVGDPPTDPEAARWVSFPLDVASVPCRRLIAAAVTAANAVVSVRWAVDYEEGISGEQMFR